MPQLPPQDCEAAISTKLILRRIGFVYIAFLVVCALLATQISPSWPLWLSLRLLMQQDVWLLALQLVVAALTLMPLGKNLSVPAFGTRVVGPIALAVVLFCYFGFTFVLGAYDVTRDEQMAVFDSIILGHGHLVWPIPAEWQSEAKALNTLFMFPVEHPVAWVSAYLPGNAALRALVGQFADPALTGPLLTAGSLILAYSCARVLWPDDRVTASVVVLLLLGSGQVLLMGMSSYAMPAHLFFNLLWLRLFLADRRTSDIAALLIGAIATGLHQPLFHPMFVAPFLLTLLQQKAWKRLAVFVIGYAAIGLGWMAWPVLIKDLIVGPQSAMTTSGADYLTRLLEALSANSDHTALMAANLLRFCIWQHPLTVPLMLVGAIASRHDRRVQALVLGICVTILVMAAILPWQGNGFGYRYLHGLIGNCVLLAGFGWRRTASHIKDLQPAFFRASLASILVLVPAQIWLSHQRYAPFAAANRQIEATGADYLLLQAGNGISYGSLVYNLPDLSNRPIRIKAEDVTDHESLARRICTAGTTVALAGNGFFHGGAAYFRIHPSDTAERRLPALRKPYERWGCRILIMQAPALAPA